MKWVWFCKCGQQVGETTEKEDFCLFNCFSCGRKLGRAIKRQVFSLREKFVAWWLGEKLIPKEVVSITEAAQKKRFHKEHPNAQ